MFIQHTIQASASYIVVGTTITITSNGVVDLSNITGISDISGYTVQVSGATNVQLQQTGAQLTNVTINCQAGTNLFIDGLNIKNTSDISAITFTGVGNTLNLTGANMLEKGEGIEALIRVEEQYLTELTINNTDGQSGTLNAAIIGNGNNDNYGAVIGSKLSADCGTTNIAGGIVNATISNVNYSWGAAIGGGYSGEGGNITISGGTVNATVTGNTVAGAVIGGGYYGNGGNITISGGAVNTVLTGSAIYAAAIGGGFSGTGANLTIDSGSVTVVATILAEV